MSSGDEVLDDVVIQTLQDAGLASAVGPPYTALESG